MKDLLTQKQQIAAQIASLEARSGSERRKIENRAVWLLGRLLRDSLSGNPDMEQWVRRELPARLSARDRENGLWQTLFPNDEGAAS